MNHIQTFVKSRLKTYSKSYSKLQDKISDILSKGNWSGSQGAWKECYEYIASHEDDFVGTSIEVASKILQDKTGYPEFIVMDVLNDLKSELVTNSECPVCHSNPCTCAQVATMSEDKLLDEVKTDLVALVTANAGDIDTAEAIEVIKSATKDDLVDMIAEEIEDQGKEESLATYIEGLSKAKDKLSGNCGEMKTHSKFDFIGEEISVYNSLDELMEDIKDQDEDDEFPIITDKNLPEIRNFLGKYMKFPSISIITDLDLTRKGEEIVDRINSKKILDTLELSMDPQLSFNYYGDGIISNIMSDVSGSSFEYLVPVDLISTFSRNKTYSAMAELDLQFKGDLDALLKRYESSVNGLPKIGSDDTAEEFWKKCIKWADDVEKNPEPALYNELVALGKKYNVDVK